MKAKLFICNHPNQLFIYRNLIKLIKKYSPESKIILFKVNHPYFSKFDFISYKKYFDKIIEFDFIHYKKNFWLGLWEIFNFQRKLKKVSIDLLADFGTIDLFLNPSAYLSVNIMLHNLSKIKNIKNIFRLSTREPDRSSHTKFDRFKTFLCRLYSLPFKCFKIRAISDLEGRFIDFIYAQEVPGTVLKITSPLFRENIYSDDQKDNILPYPIIFENSSQVSPKRNMIIIFGDECIFRDYFQYFPDYETYIKKIIAIFKAIENKYSNYELYFKPHPADKKKIPPELNASKYALYDSSISAQELFEENHRRIRAVYSFCSSALTEGSFFGIPSYSFYRYVSNPAGVEYFDSLFNQWNMKSQFILHISDLNEIGKIDNLERPEIDVEKLERECRKILHI